ncbi:uncharacterized protein DFL_006304 [Arthrobotrys flagrans]|uniref:FHA domain-containing protein n=1 Tax=Arthrobotrys flagrans TaxID=97331 RepID=A0A436ZZX4_ARTFL|nr:hypothetical protein DFL_006304 [Arthrobotrys flagrans]
MGRWDSPSPTRARSRSPRDSSSSKRRDGKRDEKRDQDRDTQRKRSRWEDDESRDDGKRGGRESGRDRDRDRDYRDRGDKGRRGDRSRDRDRDRKARNDERRQPRSRSKSRNPSQEPEAPPKEAPNFNRTTHLVSETNTLNGVVLKYVEPSESRLPPASPLYRLYVFKASEILETIILSTRTAWLFGRDRLVADVPIDHPSASKQHAVIQFRFVTRVNDYGEREGGVKPYIIDLGSANGTTVNGDTVPEKRYFELKEKDVVMFGHSTREYVLMLEK